MPAYSHDVSRTPDKRTTRPERVPPMTPNSSPAQRHRIGSPDSLNTVPLTRGIEPAVVFAPPAQLAKMLARDELDAALVSITAVLFSDRYDVLDGIAISSRGAVKSVLLAYRRPLEELREVRCDPASLTSVNLVKVLLGERGLKPRFRPLRDYADALNHDAVLLIGDAALDFLFERGVAGASRRRYTIWDLGAAWWELTGLPFVYAAWALRRGAGTLRLRELLGEAKARGVSSLEAIACERSDYGYEFRREYLGGHIRYDLGADEKRGLKKFAELLRQHGLGLACEPRYVT